MDKTGILLINLGSPDSPRSGDVRRYLREFLSDPRVIDINPLGRWLLLHLIILPFRPAKSGKAYASIWTERGSPLLALSRDLRDRVAELLGPEYEVKLAMRYGNPSIAKAAAEFHAEGIDRIRVLPLYPQYSTAATASSIDKVFTEFRRFWNTPAVQILPPFFDRDEFLAPYAEKARALHQAAASGGEAFDQVLFSFHGIPERHVKKADVRDHCRFNAECCAQVDQRNAFCYRAQCFATARGLAERMGLREEEWSVSFQSRLGRTPWLKPYTDFELAELPSRGVKRLLMLSPAFVADCLETLEEINMAGRETFLEHGGEHFEYAPCPNADPAWAEGVAKLVRG